MRKKLKKSEKSIAPTKNIVLTEKIPRLYKNRLQKPLRLQPHLSYGTSLSPGGKKARCSGKCRTGYEEEWELATAMAACNGRMKLARKSTETEDVLSLPLFVSI